MHRTEQCTPLALLHNDALTRQALARLLRDMPGYSVVLETPDPHALKRAVAAGNTPGALVLGLDLARPKGYELLRWCRQQIPATRLLVIGACNEGATLAALLLAGAHGFCCTRQGSAHLCALLTYLLQGALYFPDEVHDALGTLLTKVADLPRPAKPLGKRQQEFMRLLANHPHLTYPAMARRMGLSLSRVHQLRAELFALYNVRRTTELVRVAV